MQHGAHGSLARRFVKLNTLCFVYCLVCARSGLNTKYRAIEKVGIDPPVPLQQKVAFHMALVISHMLCISTLVPGG